MSLQIGRIPGKRNLGYHRVDVWSSGPHDCPEAERKSKLGLPGRLLLAHTSLMTCELRANGRTFGDETQDAPLEVQLGPDAPVSVNPGVAAALSGLC